MSKRQEIVDRIEDFLSENELSSFYLFSGKIQPSGKKTQIYVVNFAKPRTIDAEIQIYGKTFLKLKFQTAYRDLSQNDNLVFKSEQDLIDFLKFAFVEHDSERAYQVPRK